MRCWVLRRRKQARDPAWRLVFFLCFFFGRVQADVVFFVDCWQGEEGRAATSPVYRPTWAYIPRYDHDASGAARITTVPTVALPVEQPAPPHSVAIAAVRQAVLSIYLLPPLQNTRDFSGGFSFWRASIFYTGFLRSCCAEARVFPWATLASACCA